MSLIDFLFGTPVEQPLIWLIFMSLLFVFWSSDILFEFVHFSVNFNVCLGRVYCWFEGAIGELFSLLIYFILLLFNEIFAFLF